MPKHGSMSGLIRLLMTFILLCLLDLWPLKMRTVHHLKTLYKKQQVTAHNIPQEWRYTFHICVYTLVHYYRYGGGGQSVTVE